MKQIVFEATYKTHWETFERWLDDAASKKKKRAEGNSPLADLDVPRAYRRVCQLLALARERQYSPDLIDRLNRIALRGHHVLYAARSGSSLRLLAFLTTAFPRLVRQEWRLVAVAACLFAGPLLLLLATLPHYPDFIYYFVDPGTLARFEEMYDPANPRFGMRQSDDNTMMFAYYIWNNVKIGFQTFATGLLFGLGSVYYLVFNGAQIGAVAGHFSGAGFNVPFWSFVSGHSALELTAIMLSGAAGLKLGAALLMPGPRSRTQALVHASRPAVRIMYGAALMFLAAAFVEGFWSPISTLPAVAKYATGIVMWGLVLGYFFLAGRGRAA